MTKSTNTAKGEKKTGIVVGETGDVYFPRRYGGIDMHVSGPGALLAVLTADGGTRPADHLDIARLKRAGGAVAVEAIVPGGRNGERPIRRVDVVGNRPAPDTLAVMELMTPVPSVRTADGSERHGPPSPQEYADHIASTLVFEAVTNPFLTTRAAYAYYFEALHDLNRRHVTGRIGPMSRADFQRLMIIARCLLETEAEPPADATIH